MLYPHRTVVTLDIWSNSIYAKDIDNEIPNEMTHTAHAKLISTRLHLIPATLLLYYII